MKVKPSVKPICEKCKVIKRKGRVMVICQNPEAQTASGLIAYTIPADRRSYPRRSTQACIQTEEG